MADFASRLKQLRKERKLRQIDLADEMGVAQTTIANYEQHSRFPDEETLRKIANFLEVSLDFLLGRSDVNLLSNRANTAALNKEHLSDLAKGYIGELLAGRKEEAYSLIINEAKAGKTIRSIYAEVFESALIEVGSKWEINEIDVSREHYFSEATESLMGQLRAYLQTPDTARGILLAVTVNGEFHQIGIKMITDILEEEGWQTFYIGINTPTADLVKGILETDADVLAISATMAFNADSVANMILHIRSALRKSRKELKIVVGGLAFASDRDLWQRVGADSYAGSLAGAVSTINSLHDEINHD
ncbi:MAG: helix-turn-helix domain-containing protein [Spirochaetales bacterium]|nr:helix-turn-helix domain-containing protein [Spirochaetales bacterium]